MATIALNAVGITRYGVPQGNYVTIIEGGAIDRLLGRCAAAPRMVSRTERVRVSAYGPTHQSALIHSLNAIGTPVSV